MSPLMFNSFRNPFRCRSLNRHKKIDREGAFE
nr:MAG TPA: hypothetical protein [Caudoviricetes sp.]DAP61319.1 MAG TPA: hypothetical protein [Caudoviricetes sp.]